MRLIDADAYEYPSDLINEPTITLDDLVVHCRDCAVPHNKWTGCPMLNGLVTPPNFYCAMGEMKK